MKKLLLIALVILANLTFSNIKKYVDYYDNGQIEVKGKYVNGKREGERLAYYDNGKIKTKGKYVNGIREGEWLYYDENGQIEVKATYKNGNIVE